MDATRRVASFHFAFLAECVAEAFLGAARGGLGSACQHAKLFEQLRFAAQRFLALTLYSLELTQPFLALAEPPLDAAKYFLEAARLFLALVNDSCHSLGCKIALTAL